MAFFVFMFITMTANIHSFAQQSDKKSQHKMIGIVDGAKSRKNYEDWLVDYGLAYRIVTSPAEADDCSVVIFCGGPDLGIDTKRDKLDSLVYEECRDKNIPIFGICRGMQEICFLMCSMSIWDSSVEHCLIRK